MNTSPTPKFVPTADELSKVERDLRFHPATVENPQTLSRQEVARFNRDGYLKGMRIFDDAEIAELRRYFDDLLAWGSHFFCKMPGDGKRVAWHQDASYWPLTPSKAVTIWLAIDDASVENACMRYIPGSHRLGHLTYRLSETDEANVLNQTVEGIEKLEPPVDVELKAGEVSMHSDLLLHGSEANQSARRRCGLTLRYCPADVKAGLGWNAKGVIVSGVDVSGHWGNAPRPSTD